MPAGDWGAFCGGHRSGSPALGKSRWNSPEWASGRRNEEAGVRGKNLTSALLEPRAALQRAFSIKAQCYWHFVLPPASSSPPPRRALSWSCGCWPSARGAGRAHSLRPGAGPPGFAGLVVTPQQLCAGSLQRSSQAGGTGTLCSTQLGAQQSWLLVSRHRLQM